MLSPVQNIEDIYELSPMQQGMLFHTLYAPHSGVYVEQLSCTLQGNLNVQAFKQAWQQVVNRHPVFRTSLMWENLDKPVQIVHRNVEIPWMSQDWQTLSGDARQKQLEAVLLADRKQGFALDQPPLMRCALLRETDDAYRFVWTHHHVLMDGWCLPIVMQEVFNFYEDLTIPNPPLTPPRRGIGQPRPYRDYILWLRPKASGGRN